jgi:hypothetical protein
MHCFLLRGIPFGEPGAQVPEGGVQAGEGWVGGLDLGEIIEGGG